MRIWLITMIKAKILLLSISLLVWLSAPAYGQQPSLVSINRTKTGSGNGRSSYSAISGNGRFVVFQSDASNLVANDTNGSAADVFVRDLLTGSTKLVSVNKAGTGSGNNRSFSPVINADGRFVAFTSRASNLVANDTNGSTADVFVRDLKANTTTLVSINSTATGSGVYKSGSPVISDDGQKVAFVSEAPDLVTNDINGSVGDVFVRDLLTKTTSLVSIKSTGEGSGNFDSSVPKISADGKLVAFQSEADDLVGNDLNGLTDVFIRDLVAGKTSLISVNRHGDGSGNEFSDSPVISGNGRFVAFTSSASDLVANDTNGNSQDVFVRDRQAGVTRLVSVNRAGTGSGNDVSGVCGISADGRFILFASAATDLTPIRDFAYGFTNDLFVRNLSRNTTTLVSINHTGRSSGNHNSDGGTISADGRFVAFVSYAGDLVPNDSNNQSDVFVRNLAERTTILLSANQTSTGSGNLSSSSLSRPTISGDGRFVAFESDATDLIANDTNRVEDVFAAPTRAGIFRFSASRYNADESAGHIIITVNRAFGSEGQVKVNYAATNGTATANADYTAVRGTLTFANGETSKTFAVPIANDAVEERTETVNLSLSNPVGGAGLRDLNKAVLNILGDNTLPALSINNVTVTEGNSAATQAIFTVKLSAVTGQVVTVRYATANGTATAPNDYAAVNGLLTFNPGETTKTISVQVKGDLLKEPNETFKLNLSAPTKATLADGLGIGTVINND
jgi:hypothetical protein